MYFIIGITASFFLLLCVWVLFSKEMACFCHVISLTSAIFPRLSLRCLMCYPIFFVFFLQSKRFSTGKILFPNFETFQKYPLFGLLLHFIDSPLEFIRWSIEMSIAPGLKHFPLFLMFVSIINTAFSFIFTSSSIWVLFFFYTLFDCYCLFEGFLGALCWFYIEPRCYSYIKCTRRRLDFGFLRWNHKNPPPEGVCSKDAS